MIQEMIDAPHFGFVAAAYAIAVLVVVGMIIAVAADYREQSRALRRFEETRGRQGEA
jgi:heme exporter protein CcmD